jgi:hypothetical protein
MVASIGGCSEPPTVCGTTPASPRVEGARLPVELAPRGRIPAGLTDRQIAAALPPADPKGSLIKGVMRGLMGDTLKMAGVLGDVEPGACAAIAPAENDGSSERCSVKYEGYEAVWNVRFTDVEPGQMTTARYRATPVVGLLTARRVYAWGSWDGKQRCDRLPAVIRVDGVGTPTKYACQQRYDECHSDNGRGWRFWWVNQAVTIDENGNVDWTADGPHG